MKKEIKEKIEEIFKEFPDIKIDEFKFVIDALAEFFKSEKEKWEKEQIMAIDKRILEGIKKEQGTDEFYETIVKPIEKRVKEKLLERVLNMVFIEVKRKSIQNGEYGLSAGEAEEIREKLKEELKKELKVDKINKRNTYEKRNKREN